MFWQLYDLCPDPWMVDILGLLIWLWNRQPFNQQSFFSVAPPDPQFTVIWPIGIIPTFPHFPTLLDRWVVLCFLSDLLFHSIDTTCFFWSFVFVSVVALRLRSLKLELAVMNWFLQWTGIPCRMVPRLMPSGWFMKQCIHPQMFLCKVFKTQQLSLPRVRRFQVTTSFKKKKKSLVMMSANKSLRFLDGKK